MVLCCVSWIHRWHVTDRGFMLSASADDLLSSKFKLLSILLNLSGFFCSIAIDFR